jgi:hypothetical protein
VPVDDKTDDELGVWFVAGGDCMATGGVAALRLRLVTPGDHDDPPALAGDRSIALFLTRERATEIAHALLDATQALPPDRKRAH